MNGSIAALSQRIVTETCGNFDGNYAVDGSQTIIAAHLTGMISEAGVAQ